MLEIRASNRFRKDLKLIAFRSLSSSSSIFFLPKGYPSCLRINYIHFSHHQDTTR